MQLIRTLVSNGHGLHNRKQIGYPHRMGSQSSKLSRGYQQHGLQGEYRPCVPSRGVTQEGKLINTCQVSISISTKMNRCGLNIPRHPIWRHFKVSLLGHRHVFFSKVARGAIFRLAMRSIATGPCKPWHGHNRQDVCYVVALYVYGPRCVL